jgi:hypothetical protein
VASPVGDLLLRELDRAGISPAWKTPYDQFYTYLAHQDRVVTENRKPQQAHLKVYGCKAFAMTPEAQDKKKRLQRFNPKAWIGYLVGYQSTNIYRIWVPSKNKVINSRDVIFDEETTFDGNIKTMQDDLLHMHQEEFAELINQADINTVKDRDRDENQSTEDALIETEMSALDLMDIAKKFDNPYPTPDPSIPSSPASLFTATIGEKDTQDHEDYEEAEILTT